MSDSKRYIIDGGHQLNGHVRVQSAKNALSKQIVASLLTDEPCILKNIPQITEVDSILAMLGEIGTLYEWLDNSTLKVHTPEIKNSVIGAKYSGFNRLPILLLGPLLHRAGETSVPVVGGCDIGPRPVNFHIESLRKMGAEIEDTTYGYDAKSAQLKGTTIVLPYPSVGATENVLITASLAKGTTVISNAAIEPEIIDTILFLQKMGALIRVEVDRRIVIEGVDKLHGVVHQPVMDRIEAASYAAAAVATNGRIKVEGAEQQHLITFLNNIRKVGGGFTVERDGITFFRDKDVLRPLHLETDVHPGFMTDWQQPFVVLLTQAQGVSVVHETVYENRFGYTRELVEMGADIDLTTACLGSTLCRFKDNDYHHSCIVRGHTPLVGKPITIPDLRAGFAYIIAALVAEGESVLSGIRYVERGYAQVPEKLESIGASIRVVDVEPA